MNTLHQQCDEKWSAGRGMHLQLQLRLIDVCTVDSWILDYNTYYNSNLRSLSKFLREHQCLRVLLEGYGAIVYLSPHAVQLHTVQNRDLENESRRKHPQIIRYFVSMAIP